MILKKLLSFGSLCLLSAAVSAHADTIFTLTSDACSGGCGTAPFGTITLSQGASGVTVTEVLKAGETYAVTGAGKSLEFQLSGAFTISGLTAGFLNTGAATASTFGSFNNSVECGPTICANGGKLTNYGGTLTFLVAGATIADFIANSHPTYFTSDILGTSGNTGNVGANCAGVVTTSAVPEPSTLVFLGTGIAGAAGAIRRRLKA